MTFFLFFFCRKREKALQNKNLKREENVLFYKNDAALTCDTLSCDKCIWGKFFKKEKTIAFAVCPHLLRIFQFQLKKISVNQEFMQNHGMDLVMYLGIHLKFFYFNFWVKIYKNRKIFAQSVRWTN